VCFLLDGPHLVDLDSGLGTLLDGQPVRDQIVRDGQTIQIGEQRLTVHLAGEVTAPDPPTSAPGVALTVIYGPHAGETALLPPGRLMRLGRAHSAELSLPRESLLVGEHLELRLELPASARPVVQVRDLAGRRDVLVNREPIHGLATLTPGDVIQFGGPQGVGPTALFLHLDPQSAML
jgi:hypothetical protein